MSLKNQPTLLLRPNVPDGSHSPLANFAEQLAGVALSDFAPFYQAVEKRLHLLLGHGHHPQTGQQQPARHVEHRRSFVDLLGHI